jgi:pimeloyl-ACP methyl ester carboxylesterase
MEEKQVNQKKKRPWLFFSVSAILLLMTIALSVELPLEQEKKLRREFREAVKSQFPEQAAQVARSFGLKKNAADGDQLRGTEPDGRTVVLIHGLDDPGKVWMNLGPALARKNYNVWTMRYPNDQPIHDSALFLLDELRQLKQKGVDRIAIVGHSMGGLVSREMLTNPLISYPTSVAENEVPKVLALVMVGTPNHGSELARFRVFGEIRDQWVHMTAGSGHWLRGILDGAGEAKIDLLPGSLFLESLNARPDPEGVKMLIVAGIASPWGKNEIEKFVTTAQAKIPDSGQENLREIEKFLTSMTDGLGDGLVTVDSTRLTGIAHKTVHGTHLSMIRNITKGSRRLPPAVPIIVDYLKQVYAGVSH